MRTVNSTAVNQYHQHRNGVGTGGTGSDEFAHTAVELTALMFSERV